MISLCRFVWVLLLFPLISTTTILYLFLFLFSSLHNFLHINNIVTVFRGYPLLLSGFLSRAFLSPFNFIYIPLVLFLSNLDLHESLHHLFHWLCVYGEIDIFPLGVSVLASFFLRQLKCTFFFMLDTTFCFCAIAPNHGQKVIFPHSPSCVSLSKSSHSFSIWSTLPQP